MKKIIKTFVVTLICVFSIANVFAYQSEAAVYVNGGSGYASKSAWIGYSYNASAIAINNASSNDKMIMQIWGSWQGAMFPNTVEAQTTLYSGNQTRLKDTQEKISIFQLVLSPNSAQTTGRGKIIYGTGDAYLP